MMSPKFKSNHGFGLIEIIVAIVVVAVLAGGVYVYYQSQTNDNDSKLTTQEQKEVAAACKLEIDDDLLCKTFATWSDAASEPYTVTTTAGTDEAEMVYKVDGDNYHSIMRYEDRTLEGMKVDGVSYSKMNGVWYKDDEAESEALNASELEVPGDVGRVFDEDRADKTDFRKLGNEACGDTTCVKYEIATMNDTEGKAYVWIDEKKARVMRFETNDPDGSKLVMNYEYGPVEIVAPADAKDMSEMMNF